jgi:hypothetical protein
LTPNNKIVLFSAEVTSITGKSEYYLHVKILKNLIGYAWDEESTTTIGNYQVINKGFMFSTNQREW